MSVRAKEKNINVISEFIDLYSPQNGLVVDPCGGTITTPVASMHISRSCIVMGQNNKYYREGLRPMQRVFNQMSFVKVNVKVNDSESFGKHHDDLIECCHDHSGSQSPILSEYKQAAHTERVRIAK